MADVKEHVEFDVEFTDNIKEASSDLERMQRIFDQTNKKMEKLSETSNKNVKSITALGDAAKKAFEEAARAVDTDEENFKSFTNQVEKTASAMTALKKAMDAIDKSGNSDAFAKQRESLEAMYNSAKSANELSSAWLDEYMRKTVANTGKGVASVPSRSVAEQKKINDAALKGITPEKVKAYQEAAPKHKAPVEEEEVKSASKELDGLEQDIDNITKKFNDMFASGDRKGMKAAVQEAEQLKQKIASMKATDGIGEDDLARLKELESRLSSVVAESEKEIRKRTFSGLKSAIDGAERLALAALKRGYSTAVRLTKSWLNIMNRTFKTVLRVWQKLLSKVFNRNSGGSLLGNQLKGMLGVASIAGLTALGKQMIELSADMFEVQNVIQGVFGSAEQEISDFCDTSIEKFGLTALEARKLAGVFGGILKASHIVGDAQQEMSKNLTALSGDIASFYNISVDEASSKLQSGLVGNISAMRSLGINMTVANLEAYALSKGITTSWHSLDQASKTTLRYNYILEQTRAAQGDYAKTFGSWANQVRLLTSNLKQLASIIGGALIKVLYPVLSLLNQIVSAAINAANALAKAFNFQAVDLAKMFGGSGGITLPDTSDYEEGMEDVAGATNDAADATAKLNDNLQSFDRLNNISSQTANKSSEAPAGVSSGVGGLLDFDSYYKNVKEPDIVVNEKLQKVLDVIKQWVKDVASVDYRNIKSAWKNLSDAIKPVAEDIGRAIQWLWKNVLFPFYEWAATQGAPAVINLMAAALEALHEILIAVAPEIDDFWKNTLAPYFSAKGESFTTTLQNWTDKLKEWTRGLQDADDKMGYLKDTVTSAKDAMYAWIGDTFITDRLDSIGEHIQGIWGNLKDGSVYSNVKSILSAFTKLSLVVFDNILKMIETLSADKNVGEFIDFLAEQFGELADATFDSIIELIQYLAKSETFKDTIRNVKEAIMNVIKYVVDNKEGIVKFLHGVSEAVKWLSQHLGVVKALIGVVLGTKVILSISKVVSAVTKLKSAISLLKSGLTALKGTKVFATIASSVKGLFTKIHELLKSGIAALGETVTASVGTLLSGVVAFVVGWGIGSKIYEKFGPEIDAILHPIFDKIVELWNSIVEFFKEAWETVKADFQAIGDFFSGIWTGIKDTAITVKDTIVSGWETATATLKEGWQGLKTTASGVWNSIKTKASGIKDEVVGLWGSGWSTIKEGATTFKDFIVDDVWGKIKSTASDLWDSITSGFSDIWENIKDGASKAFTGIKDTVTGWAGDIVDGVKDVFDIHSPSRVFREIFGYVVEGAALGIEDNTGIADSAMSDMTNSLLSIATSTDIDLSSMIDVSRFSDKYKDIIYQTEDFNKEMSKYGDMTPAEYQSSMITSPRVKQAQLSANIAQSGVSTLSEGISALYSQAKGTRSDSGKLIECQIVVGSKQFAQFIIDTVTGRAVQTGNF